ncbi:hypothetical protein B0J11DRAFT_554324 [Dendryphion nanum]|uniref:Uncharacterized protein n=1 Tax=Dendryphion nanum TaxID=256645 RepID=A0A9P9I8G9_9PLEO|nr:hypothetical protein B0J11DRAFT_554324 [Dendryphion nanum]
MRNVAIWIDSIPAPQNLVPIPHIAPCAADDKENPRPARKRHLMQFDSDQTPRPLKRLRDLNDSGRLSPVKQLQLLEDFEEQPVVFCNFDDKEDGEEPEDVTEMRRADQRFADSIGILGYDDMEVVISTLSSANNVKQRYGRKHDHGSGVSEDEWNSEVQHPLLKLARNTCKRRQTLDIHNVYVLVVMPADHIFKA